MSPRYYNNQYIRAQTTFPFYGGLNFHMSKLKLPTFASCNLRDFLQQSGRYLELLLLQKVSTIGEIFNSHALYYILKRAIKMLTSIQEETLQHNRITSKQNALYCSCYYTLMFALSSVDDCKKDSIRLQKDAS